MLISGAFAVNISIHALREEGDLRGRFRGKRFNVFLSTPSARRATQAADRFVIVLVISIHALREEGDAGQIAPDRPRRIISIHALREEGDGRAAPMGTRPPDISIHALREEGDAVVVVVGAVKVDFYPRPPRGGRPTGSGPSMRCGFYFYPRPPRGGRPSGVP